MPEKSVPEEMTSPVERGAHLHHKEQPATPEFFGGKEERFRTEWARNSAKVALGVESAKREVLDPEIEKLSSESLKVLLRSYIRLPEQILRTDEGRRQILEKERFLREDLIGKGELSGRDLEVAEKLLASIGRKVGRLPRPEIGVGPLPEGEDVIRVLKSIEEEIKAGRKINQAIKDAVTKTAAATIPEIKTRVSREIEEIEAVAPQEKQTNWLRARLAQLESFEIPFDSYANTQTITEIHSVLGELAPELQEEYWARHFLHAHAMAFGAGLREASERAGAVSMTNLQRLAQVPGVAIAFQEYERRARQEREIYEKIRAGERSSIEPQDKLITAVGPDVTQIRKQIARKVEKEAGLEDGSGAQRISERIWHITGRSAYWDAFTLVSREKEDGTVSLEPFQGKGALAGPVWLRRLHNFPAYVEQTLKKGYGMLHPYMDLGLRDFWSRSAVALGVTRKDVLEANKNWVGPLDEIDISKLQFVEKLTEGDYLRMMVHAGYADDSRKLLSEAGGFLDQPSWENYTKLLEIFQNLPQEKRKEKLGIILEGFFEFNRQRGLFGRDSYSKRFLKWRPWADQMIFIATEGLFRGGYISDEAREEIERRFDATKGKVEVTGRSKAVLGALPGTILDVIGAAIKGEQRGK